MPGIRWLAIPLLSLALGAQAAPSPLPELLDAMAQRLTVADQVARSKHDSGKPVLDETRERQVLDSVGQAAQGAAVSPATAQTFFAAQMEANKLVQYGLLDAWRRGTRPLPAATPDLAGLRTRLDTLQTRLLAGLAATGELRAAADCSAQLDKALTAHLATAQPDDLHRLALLRALGDFCALPR
ncbi:chorismate mutase [Pseudomonas oryzihabitans]|uniref:chorismate mutase n=1 Tax=Pseudomonas oryzihabitans TaxID=47885 RepID=UPI00285F3D40|nr:chorismate mutase [Pseudomonas psychrotolerans]MDR6677001.1 chorismate mutase [Pseudomonas psychrotolerans]